jgi:hypothetical protein
LGEPDKPNFSLYCTFLKQQKMVNTEPIYDLLRTNSINQYLSRRSKNQYVGVLRQLLNELGYQNELQWDRLKADYFFGEETVLAVRTFAQRNGFPSDGLAVTPQMAIRIIQRYDTIEGLSLIQQGLEANNMESLFNPLDPNNYGSQQLKMMLQSLAIYESDLPEALRQYALKQSLFFENGSRFSPNIARAMMAELLPAYGDRFALRKNPINEEPFDPLEPDPFIPPIISPLEPLPSKELDIVDSTSSVSVSDGAVQIDFRKRDAGVYTVGFHPVGPFVNEYSNKLLSLELTPPSIAVVESVSRNEGNLDAINTYDRGFVSLGIFQWTLGTEDKAGELAALLKKIKTVYPHTFRVFFQNFGLDISENTGTTYGYLTYNGRQVSEPFLKNQFREPEWAFRFWRAAQNIDVQSVEIKHALARLNNFYWKDSYRVLGHGLNEVITSSYGVALLLDNHVNRPSWVGECVELAMTITGLTDSPTSWGDAEENRLLDEYLKVRANDTANGYPPMTKAQERARGMLADVRTGNLQTNRGSFQVSELALRSYSDIPRDSNNPSSYETSLTPDVVLPPPYYAQEDYPDIEMDLDK